MKNIAIFQSDLGFGGIQKSLVNLLNSLDYSQVSVDLFLYSKSSIEPAIPFEVNVTYLAPFSRFLRVLPFGVLKLLRSKPDSEKSYDLSIDYNGYWPECAIGALGIKSKMKVMWIHSDVKGRLTMNKKFRILWKSSFQKFASFDRFVAVSQGSAAAFVEMSKTKAPVLVIPNILRPAFIHSQKNASVSLEIDESCTNLISVGRLTPHKGFDDLITIFNQAHQQRPDLRLYILGEGSYRSQLEQLVSAHNLEKVVFLLGSNPNPYAIMNRMDAFVFASRYEGQAIVLNEAQILGLPILMTKNLEKFNVDIRGVDDLGQAMIQFKKQPKVPDDLISYHQKIKATLSELFGCECFRQEEN